MSDNNSPSCVTQATSTIVWGNDFVPSEGLKVIASSSLPPPSVGSACIFQGTIPEPVGSYPDFAAISFLLEGTLMVERLSSSGAQMHLVKPGTFGLEPVGSGAQYRTQGKHISLNLAIEDRSIQHFACRELEACDDRVELTFRIGASDPIELVQLGQSFARLIYSPRKGASLYAETLWTQILLQVLWHHSSLSDSLTIQEPSDIGDTKMRMVIDFMRSTLSQDISLSDLARESGFSPGYFLRSFKKATGKTPFQYRLDLRIERSCELLKGTLLEISDIADLLGFSSHGHFANAFRRAKGISPTEFRRLQ